MSDYSVGFAGAPWGEPIDRDDEVDEFVDCPQCGGPQEWETCHQCQGEGGRDLYEEDPIAYEPNDWEDCRICDGLGGYLVCLNLPHKEPTPQAAIK